MNRKLVILGVVGVIFVGLLVAGTIMLGKKKSAVADAKNRLNSLKSEVRRLYDTKPFPSETNIFLVKEQAVQMESVVAAFTNTLPERNVERVDLSPSRFIQELQTALSDRLTASAPIVEGKRAIPANFNFGFDRYMTAGAPMPREQDVPRLAQQLAVIEKLVEALYGSRVVVREIKRDEFEAATDSGGGRATGRARRIVRDEAEAEGGVSSRYEGKYYSSQRFELGVIGRQSSLSDLVNRLSTMNMFAVVTDFRMSKLGGDLRPPRLEVVPKQGVGGLGAILGGTAEKGEKEESVDLISKLPPSQRIVSGIEVDPPIEATIVVDVLYFGKEAE